jgi:protein ImuA
MAKTSVAVLESALRERKLDHTVVSGARSGAVGCTPTTVRAIDGCLAGGLPRGQLCEIAGIAGSGRTTLLLQLLAGVTRQGDIAALVDTTDRLDVASARAAGVDFERLLWIRGYATALADHAHGASSSLERAIKALNLVLQAGGFSVVAIDLADVPTAALTRLPFTTWLRLQRAIEGSDTTCVLLVSEPLARSAGGLTVSLTGRTEWRGTGGSRRFTGMAVSARMQSPRRYANGETTFGALALEA